MKETPQDHPKYVGFWLYGVYRAIPVSFQDGAFNSSSFRMFIDSKRDLGDDVLEISGRIKDKYGGARFEGTMSPDKVKFTKTYEPKHSHSHASKKPFLYEGKISKELSYGNTYYEGKFKIKDDEGNLHEKGVFVLEKHNPSKTLELLMKKDNKE